METTMKTLEAQAIDLAVLADLEAVCNTTGIVRAPELYRRVTERADRVRQETLELFGVHTIGAQIICEMHAAE